MLFKIVLFLMKYLAGSNLLRLATSKLGIAIEAILLGALCSASIAPLQIWPCLVIGLVFFMMLLCVIKTKKGIFYTTILFFASYSTVSLNWLNFVMEDFGKLPFWLSHFVVLVFSIFYIALPYAVFNVIAFAFTKKRTESYLCFFVPIAFILGDFYVTYVLTGFPWIIPGYACIEGPLKNFAPFLGVKGISALVYIMSAAIALTALRKFLYLPIAAVILCIGLMTEGITFTQKRDPLEVLMVQGNIEQAVRNNGSKSFEVFSTYWDKTEQNKDGFDVVIWPESAIPVVYQFQKDFLDDLNTAFVDSKQVLITGIFSMDEEQNKIYNSMMTFGEDKTIDEKKIYNKRALVPFGEIIPFASLLRPLGSIFDIPNSSFSYGDAKQDPIKVKGLNFIPAICYEAIFPSLIRGMDSLDTSGIIMLSNDSWFGPTKAPMQHLNIARMRTLELQKPMLRATNSGITAYIGENGKVLKTIEENKLACLKTKFYPVKGQTLYSKFGEIGISILILIWLALGLYSRFKKQDLIEEQMNKLIRP